MTVPDSFLSLMGKSWDARSETVQDAMSYIIDGYQGSIETFYESGKRHAADIIHSLKEAGCNIPYGRAVEIGCGIGRVTVWMYSMFEHVDATDISPNMISMCPPLENVTWTATGSLLKLPGRDYDLIYSIIVLQHVPKPVFWNYLDEAHAVLKRGGIFHTQLPMTIEPIEWPPEQTLLCRGYTIPELGNEISGRQWETISLLRKSGISEPWYWLTLRKR